MSHKQITFEIDSNGCHNCNSHSPDRDGYSKVKVNGKQKYIHRYLYEEEYGQIPQGIVVRHKCDNPRCINVNHLELGTIADNNRDRAERNRSADTSGSKNPIAKIKEDDVRKIRQDNRSNLVIAREYGFQRSNHIKMIKERKIWKHVE